MTMTTPRHDRLAVGQRPGFSLIEVLIAIFVLSLGLLGLAAVFPAVIAQQRDAQDRTRGAPAATEVEALLRAGTFVDLSQFDLVGARVLPNPAVRVVSAWDVPDSSTGFNYNDYRDEGLLTLRGFALPDANGIGGGAVFAELPITLRTVPQIYGSDDPGRYVDEEPLFVWDAVLKTDADGKTPMMAVFVRRFDSGITVPTDSSLSQELWDENVVPIGFDWNAYRPTGNGTGDYATPVSLGLEFTAADYADVQTGAATEIETVTLVDDDTKSFGSAPGLVRLAAQPGQKLVDNLGVVREVRAVINRGGNTAIRVSPGFRPREAYEYVENVFGFPPGTQVPSEEDSYRNYARQVVFTPTVPIEARVLRFPR